MLIDHPDGLVLFDTGYDKRFMDVWTKQDNAISTEQQQVVPQLATLGIRPADVDCIINSHLHIDHVGGNKHFPGATIVVNRTEYKAAVSPMPFEYQSYSDLSFDPELHKLSLPGAGEGAESPARRRDLLGPPPPVPRWTRSIATPRSGTSRAGSAGLDRHHRGAPAGVHRDAKQGHSAVVLHNAEDRFQWP